MLGKTFKYWILMRLKHKILLKRGKTAACMYAMLYSGGTNNEKKLFLDNLNDKCLKSRKFKTS